MIAQGTVSETRYPEAICANGMVSSAHYLASRAGVWMLRQGGNAADAAVCAATTMAVVAPHLNGVGGDLFAQVWKPGSDRPVGLNASGRSAAAATIDELRRLGHQGMPVRGALTITVPAAVSGWAALLRECGTTRLYDVIEPAIDYAEHGAPVTAKIARAITTNLEMIKQDPGFRRVFTRDGAPLREGEAFVNPELSRSLREVGATDGAGLYRGQLAEKLATGIQKAGGLVSKEDLATHEAEWVDPIETTFAGRTIYELPPNTQGVTALEMFNMAEEAAVVQLPHNSAGYIDRLIGIMERAYEDRDRYVTDPAFSEIPVQMLASRQYACRRLQSGSPERHAARESDTAYLCAVDSTGMAVSLIQSQYMGFGSGVMAKGTGIHLQNRGSYFSLDPGHVNRLEPWKRTMHTLIPAMAGREGLVDIVFGSMGGDAQPQIQLQILLNHLSFGMDLQAAVEAPRFVHGGGGRDSPRISIEGRFREPLAAELGDRGVEVEVVEDWSSLMGHAQAIRFDRETGLRHGAADPRGDGAAYGY